MRAFSSSQGKFIDIPDSPQQSGANAYSGATQPQSQTPSNISPGAIPGQSSESMTSLGIPDTSLKNIFFQMGLSNPKSINSLTSLYNFVKPNPESASAAKAKKTEADKQKAIQKGNKTIDVIYDKWKKGIANSPVNRVTGAAASITGKGALNPAQARINAEFFANLEPELRKAAVAGRITQQEISWLRANLLPNAFDSEDSAQQKVAALKTAFNEYVGEDTANQDNSSSSGGYNFNITNVHK